MAKGDQANSLSHYLEVHKARRKIILPPPLEDSFQLQRTFQAVNFKWQDLDGLHWSEEDSERLSDHSESVPNAQSSAAGFDKLESHIPFPIMDEAEDSQEIGQWVNANSSNTCQNEDDCPTPMPNQTSFEKEQEPGDASKEYDYDDERKLIATSRYVTGVVQDWESKKREKRRAKNRKKEETREAEIARKSAIDLQESSMDF
ncbi:hypothetical protein V5O48_015564 [Marasmius crinis-equi]|uniref:Uncharacterized protein n=1 Tax=Marasmius crinis-equi TaxID=585013 RepID=A0ABR3EU68_9AGAR